MRHTLRPAVVYTTILGERSQICKRKRMDNIGYYNGEFAPMMELKVPACDRGMYFGDGAYEAIRVEKHVPFALDEHLDRLYDSLRALRIPFTMPRGELCS